MNDIISSKLNTLPLKPGVYVMKDEKGNIIYVGKSRFLKNRVSQYFLTKNHDPKVSKMVENIEDFDYIVTESEYEALVLECNLIKHNMPKYNILLKDSKSYPYIKVTLYEDYPKITMSYRKDDEKATYFGPFLSVGTVNQLLDTIAFTFKIPMCKKTFPRDFQKRPCLNFQIDKCLAPCVGNISQKEYKELISQAVMFLKGNYSDIISKLKEEMIFYSDNTEYEKAAKIRDRIIAISKILEKQKVILNSNKDIDAIAFKTDEVNSCFCHFLIRGGRLISTTYHLIKNSEIIDFENIISDFMYRIYQQSSSIPKEIYINMENNQNELSEKLFSEIKGCKVKILTPKKGQYKAIIDMAEKNALKRLESFTEKSEIITKSLSELKEMLKLDKLPYRIESYDISNISGADNIGAMVVFENGKPRKSMYRTFNIKGFSGQDDYRSLGEVISRRFDKYLEKAKDESFSVLPDVILVDGGKGQVSAVKKVLKEKEIEIAVFGLAKDDKHTFKELVDESKTVTPKKTSQVYKLCYAISEEVHRFAISKHTKKHIRSNLSLEIMSIQGVGEKKARALYSHFKSLNKIKNASLEEILQVQKMDKTTANNIYNYFHYDD